MNKLEEVAKAISGAPFPSKASMHKARAALEAMREPSADMIAKACRDVLAVYPNAKWDDPHVVADLNGFRTACVHTADATWRAMIDSILTEAPTHE